MTEDIENAFTFIAEVVNEHLTALPEGAMKKAMIAHCLMNLTLVEMKLRGDCQSAMLVDVVDTVEE